MVSANDSGIVVGTASTTAFGSGRLPSAAVERLKKCAGVGVIGNCHTKRAAHGDDVADIVSATLDDRPGIQATQAPPEYGDRLPGLTTDGIETGEQPVDDLWRWPQIHPELPAEGVVAELAKQPTHGLGRRIRGRESGEYEHRAPIAAGKLSQGRKGSGEIRKLRGCSDCFGREKQWMGSMEQGRRSGVESRRLGPHRLALFCWFWRRGCIRSSQNGGRHDTILVVFGNKLPDSYDLSCVSWNRAVPRAKMEPCLHPRLMHLHSPSFPECRSCSASITR